MRQSVSKLKTVDVLLGLAGAGAVLTLVPDVPRDAARSITGFAQGRSIESYVERRLADRGLGGMKVDVSTSWFTVSGRPETDGTHWYVPVDGVVTYSPFKHTDPCTMIAIPVEDLTGTPRQGDEILEMEMSVSGSERLVACYLLFRHD